MSSLSEIIINRKFNQLKARIKDLEEALEIYSTADVIVRQPSPNIDEVFELVKGKYQPLGTAARKYLAKETEG